RLSLRRAQAIRDALIFYGVDPAMITPLGRGETNLVYYYDQASGRRGDAHSMTRAEVTMLNRDGIRGTALTDEVRGRQATNRRIEMFVCMPNSTDPVCTALDTEVRASAGTVPGADGGVSAPISTITSGDAGAPRTERRERRREEAPVASGADAGGPTARSDE
ncbi:hypothetical protein FBR05_13215, partial [Deltaproteobacteria bacterium PRO3]|nr:hypothetical protein [Deltaproteobacteria bacterium PRO3]